MGKKCYRFALIVDEEKEEMTIQAYKTIRIEYCKIIFGSA